MYSISNELLKSIMESVGIPNHVFDDAKELYKEHNNDLPYHNFDHAVSVCKRVVLLSSAYNVDLKELLLAALFHDVGYSIEKEDRENVERAVQIFRNYTKSQPELYCKIDDVCKYIFDTEFPHKKHVISLGSHMLQDADLTQVWDDDLSLLDALKEEYKLKNVNIEVSPNFPPLDMLNTSVAKSVHGAYLRKLPNNH